MNNIYLPIGSVIVTKEKPNLELLIIRNNMTIGEVNKDYLCNILQDDENLNFVHINEADIKKVLFIGYQN
ncbi:DUF4176 domain-containing protein [Mollicutes bacterium LVI A0078]|nr:DUF4176 domain-containing protein [Mollicutes bacterium LVI A0075]WOO90876.1 DUF4176 domain-containing protein [Mollicutes bacterium LVI A0078]